MSLYYFVVDFTVIWLVLEYLDCGFGVLAWFLCESSWNVSVLARDLSTRLFDTLFWFWTPSNVRFYYWKNRKWTPHFHEYLIKMAFWTPHFKMLAKTLWNVHNGLVETVLMMMLSQSQNNKKVRAIFIWAFSVQSGWKKSCYLEFHLY